MTRIQHIAGTTFHGRKGGIGNAFTYGVDYIRIEPEKTQKCPALFSRNGRNLTALHDADHGGAPGQGRGTAWVREVLAAHHADFQIGRIELLAQPRVFGHVFNPVSFWLIRDRAAVLRVVIAEVTNTYGERHSYVCAHADFSPILPTQTLTATKIFYVSPFQPIEGGYAFRFDISDARIGIWIDYTAGNGGLIATLTGKCAPLSNGSILRACLRRPFGSRRVLGLIHWQAFKLWWKGAKFQTRPTPPRHEVSR